MGEQNTRKSWLTNAAASALTWMTTKLKGGEIAQATTGGDAITQRDWDDDLDPATLRADYKKMIHDPAVKAALFTTIFELCALDIKVTPSDMEDEKATEIAEFIRYCLTRVKGGSSRGLLVKIAKPALQHQFSISEMVFEPIKIGAFKGKWGLTNIKSKNITDGAWSFRLDEFKNINAIVHTVKGEKQAYDLKKFIHYAFMPDFENPRGTSHLRAARLMWWVKRVVIRAWATYAEKAGPIPVGKYKDNAKKAALEEQLKKFSARRWIAVPASVELEVKEFASQKTQINYEKLLHTLDKEIFLSIRNAFLQALEGDRTGARSMGEVHESTADLTVWYLSAEIAGVLNEQVVPVLMELNYGNNVEPPTVTMEAAIEEDLKLQAEIDEKLSKVGLPLSKKEMYERYGRTPPVDEEDELKKPPSASPFGPGGGNGGFGDMREGDEEEEDEGDGDKDLASREDWWDDFLVGYNRTRIDTRG